MTTTTNPTTTSNGWFGDADPEDAWHPDDPVPLLLRNVARRLAIIEVAARHPDPEIRADGRRRLARVAVDIDYLRERFAD